MTTPVQTTPTRLAETLHSAKVNLFGSILVKKAVKLRKKNQDEAAKVISGTLYKEYKIKGFATVNNYETAVNNAKGRDEQEQDFQVSERKWGEHWNGSPIIIIHKERFYLQCRLTKKSTGESRFIDSMGNELSYETVEPFLLSADKRETKRKSIAATAEHQGLEVEDSVQIRDIPIDTIVSLKYGGTLYEVTPETVGAVSTPVAVAEPVKAWTPVLVSVRVLAEHDEGADPAAIEQAVGASLNAAELPAHDGIRMIEHEAFNAEEVTENA